MLTLVQTKDAIPLLGIYEVPDGRKPQQTARKKRVGTVHFTHDLDPDKQNVSVHKTYLKKENHEQLRV